MIEQLGLTILLELMLEPYLQCVLGAEMYPDWPEVDYWPLEALKAQAVAARSYAIWRIEHPRNEYFHLYGDARDQGFDCTRRHPKSDRAVLETQGEVIVSPEANFVARYVNRCGQKHCPVCHGENGYDNRTWEGRLCQFGTKALADRGLTYVEILQYYYGSEITVRRYDDIS